MRKLEQAVWLWSLSGRSLVAASQRAKQIADLILGLSRACQLAGDFFTVYKLCITASTEKGVIQFPCPWWIGQVIASGNHYRKISVQTARRNI